MARDSLQIMWLKWQQGKIRTSLVAKTVMEITKSAGVTAIA